MAGLCDLVEIMENNMECVVLKVKDGVQMQLICLGCFDGDETMFRLTKGSSHTCTMFRDGRKPVSWSWGELGHTLVCDSLWKCGHMVEKCISDDFGIYIGKDAAKREATLHIRSLEDIKGSREHYKLMWWKHSNDICIHKNGEYDTRIEGLEKAKEYVSGKITIECISEVYHSPQTGCCIMDMEGRR
ncbi:MAG: hypothetical protein K2O06_03415 [Acetatifactor sp.]|nr:hypothetical protein [Acetatifactor sp.]